ncbi:MAG TPA: NosD domain-containing protein [Dehalococcoidia bacterium]|nr:NosD domain-containing protein [Dehalococcoidia bacterium]
MARMLIAGLLFFGLAFAGGRGPSADVHGQTPGQSIQAAIDNAQPGDTVTVTGGVYHERIVIDKTVTLTGAGGPVIDGDGGGDVVTITGSGVTVSGFEIRNSGTAVSREPAAIKIQNAHEPTVRSNVIKDSLYGIHITGSHHATIAFNEIDPGENIAIERRGHGIYMWEVSEAAIHSNIINRAADGIHLEFSDDNGIAQNTVQNSRYALHLMSSDNNRIVGNKFSENLAGAVLMFSHELLLKDNDLSNNRLGASGTGILLKDADNIFVEGNTLLRNKYGMTVEGTPNSAGATATFLRNTFALNDTGVGLFSNAPITFVENAMIENTVQVEAISGALGARIGAEHGASVTTSAGSGTSDHNGHSGQDSSPTEPTPSVGSRPEVAVWTLSGRGNYWSDYSGYDSDGDGVGDRPYLPEPPFAGALDGNDTLRLFQHTLAQQAIDMASDMFPVYRYDEVIRDEGPLMTPPGPALPDGRGFNSELMIVSAMLIVLSGAILQAVLDIDVAGFLRIRRRTAGLEGRAS